MKELKGVIAALITPFSENGSLAQNLLVEHVEYLLDRGVHALATGGSAGEFEALSFEELIETYRLVVKTTAGRVPVVGGIGGRGTREAIYMAQAAERVGLDALLVFPPHVSGYELSGEEIFHYYKAIASTTHLPLMLYNWRGKAGIALCPDLVARLMEFPTIRSLKEGTADIRFVQQFLQATHNRITVMSGWDSLVLESLLMGSRGLVSGTANVCPEVHVTLYDLIAHKNYEAALTYYRQVYPLLTFLEDQGRFVAWLKAAMRLRGRDGGFPRPPYLPASEEEIALIKQALVKANIVS